MDASTFVPYRRTLIACAVGVLVALAGAAGWTAQGWRKDAEIAGLKATQSKQEAKDATGALTDYQTTAKAIAEAASGAQGSNASTAAALRAIRQEMKNAKPLPADCRPDADRLRKRNAAIEAYNRAAAGQLPGGPVQDH